MTAGSAVRPSGDRLATSQPSLELRIRANALSGVHNRRREPETGAEAVCPLKIVHKASVEIAAHRHALRGRAL